MRKISIASVIALTALGGAICGYLIAVVRDEAPPKAPAQMVGSAEAASLLGPRPAWIAGSMQATAVRHARDRGYAFCYDGKTIDRACADEQDEAISFSVVVSTVPAAQRSLDRKLLSLRENWVADHPEIVNQVRDYCWNLYRRHGAEDARILGACLGNLTEASLINPPPVP
jgi:hypothetical protein